MFSTTILQAALLLAVATAAPAEKRAAAFQLQTAYNAGNWFNGFQVQNVCVLSTLTPLMLSNLEVDFRSN